MSHLTPSQVLKIATCGDCGWILFLLEDLYWFPSARGSERLVALAQPMGKRFRTSAKKKTIGSAHRRRAFGRHRQGIPLGARGGE
jgi:hypothetical protein